MRYDLEIPEHIGMYLDGLPVSQHVRDKIAAALETLRLLPDEYRDDPANRYPNSTLLRFGYVFLGDGGQLNQITFGVDVSHAAYGVLRVCHALYRAGGQGSPPQSPSQD